MKTAEISYTDVAPATPSLTPATDVRKAVVKKTAMIGHLVPNHRQDAVVEPEEGPKYNGFTPGSTPERLPQAKIMKPHVDVTAQEPPRNAGDPENMKKKAQYTALGDRYPLDSYTDVKKASAYFDEYMQQMDPCDRHEYARNMVKRASVLGIPVSEAAERYGAESYASEAQVKLALDARRSLLQDDGHKALLDKIASQLFVLPAEPFAYLLSEFDKTAGLQHVYGYFLDDAFYATFGVEKTAQFTEVIGNRQVSASDLEYLAKNCINLVKGTFDDDLAKEFKKDPVGIYKSLPVEQRKIFANMASSQNAGDAQV